NLRIWDKISGFENASRATFPSFVFPLPLEEGKSTLKAICLKNRSCNSFLRSFITNFKLPCICRFFAVSLYEIWSNHSKDRIHKCKPLIPYCNELSCASNVLVEILFKIQQKHLPKHQQLRLQNFRDIDHFRL